MDELVQTDRPGNGLNILQMQSRVPDHFEEGKTDQSWPTCQLIDPQLFLLHRVEDFLEDVEVRVT